MTASSTAPYGFSNVEWVDQDPTGPVDTAAEVIQEFLNEKDWNFAELNPEQLKELIDYISNVLASGSNLSPEERRKLDDVLAKLVGTYAQWNTKLIDANTMQHQWAINTYFTLRMLGDLRSVGALPPALVKTIDQQSEFIQCVYATSKFLDQGTPIMDPNNIEASISSTRDFIEYVEKLEKLNPQYAKDTGLTEIKERFIKLLENYDKQMLEISKLPEDTPPEEIKRQKLAAANQFIKDAAVIYRDNFESMGMASTHPVVIRELALRNSANVLQQNDLGKNWNITDVDRPTDYSLTGLKDYRDNYLVPLKAQLEAAGNPLAAGHVQALIDVVTQEISLLNHPPEGVPIPVSLRILKFSVALASVDVASTRGLISKARSEGNEELVRQYEGQLSALESLVKTLMEMMKKIEDNYESSSLSQVGR